MTKARIPSDRIETPETTNTAIRIIMKDLIVLVAWAKADAEASRESGAMQQAGEDTARVRTYQRCHNELAGAFK